MPFTADEIANINSAALEGYLDKGTVWKQFVQNKPFLDAINKAAGSFNGGKDAVSFAVKAGQGGGGLAGYTGDDQVSYYNPTGIKRARFPWREHHIGMVITHTELKTDGIEIMESGYGEESTSNMDGREDHVLANLLDEKNDTLAEDYAYSLNRLLWGDGTADVKALAGIRSIILDNPFAGYTGNVGRVANPFWRNRAATAAALAAGGTGAITVSGSNGGSLIAFMDKEKRQRNRYKNGSTNVKYFAGSDFIEGYKLELRANGNYSMNGWNGSNADGSMPDPSVDGIQFIYDPTLDDLGYNKRCYAIDMGRTGVKLLYMNGKRMKKHSPDRPYDRYVMYNGITTTAVLVARQLNTSGVYDIA